MAHFTRISKLIILGTIPNFKTQPKTTTCNKGCFHCDDASLQCWCTAMPITHGAGKYLSSGTLISHHHMFQIKQISEVLLNAKLLMVFTHSCDYKGNQ